MKMKFATIRYHRGFSLAEMLAALTISAMILAAVLGIYSRAERTAAAVTNKLENPKLPSEILQRIAEDLDSIIAAGSDVRITIESKFDKGFPTARLAIRKTIADSKNQEQMYEEIIWQANYDYDSNSGCLVLYRSHTGLTLEDKLLDEKRSDWEERYSFVPICTGITFFKIEVPQGENFRDVWANPVLPPGIKVTISFAKPVKTVSGTMDVPEEEKIARTIAIDRIRKIRFEVPVSHEQQEQKGQEEQNKQEGQQESNDNKKQR
jgi:prepilin-type N-terminal cleavage/methylation domain-containing protein